jgi:serine/threonine protein kinase
LPGDLAVLYEQLRRRVLDGGRGGPGLDLLQREGMQSWIQTRRRLKRPAVKVDAPGDTGTTGGVFSTFQRTGSAFAVVREFRRQSWLFPRHQRTGPDHERVVWKPLSYPLVTKILHNPRYASRVTVTGAQLGTPAYMSPEQIQDPVRVTHLTDVYSMGVVLFELLTGRIPFGGAAGDSSSDFETSRAVVQDPPPGREA